jgi:hypothetical protein
MTSKSLFLFHFNLVSVPLFALTPNLPKYAQARIIASYQVQ